MSENIVGTLASTLVDSAKLLGKMTSKFINGFIVFEDSKDYDFENYFDNVKLYREVNGEIIKPKQVAEYNTPRGIAYKFTVPIGMSLKNFIKEIDGISAYLGKKVRINEIGSYIEIEIIENQLPKKIEYKLPKKN